MIVVLATLVKEENHGQEGFGRVVGSLCRSSGPTHGTDQAASVDGHHFYRGLCHSVWCQRFCGHGGVWQVQKGVAPEVSAVAQWHPVA